MWRSWHWRAQFWFTCPGIGEPLLYEFGIKGGSGSGDHGIFSDALSSGPFTPAFARLLPMSSALWEVVALRKSWQFFQACSGLVDFLSFWFAKHCFLFITCGEGTALARLLCILSLFYAPCSSPSCMLVPAPWRIQWFRLLSGNVRMLE